MSAAVTCETLTPREVELMETGIREGWPVLPGFDWIELDGTYHRAEPLIPIPPGGRIVTTAYVVATYTDRTATGRHQLRPLSAILLSAALAERVAEGHRCDEFPRASVVPLTIFHDPRDPEQMREVDDFTDDERLDERSARLQ